MASAAPRPRNAARGPCGGRAQVRRVRRRARTRTRACEGAPAAALKGVLRRKQRTLEAKLEAVGGLEGLQELIMDTPPVSPPERLANAIAYKSLQGRCGLMVELASPTPHDGGAAVAAAAAAWEKAGADAIAVSIDEEITSLGDQDLEAAARATRLPVMVLDWIMHPMQLISALKAGACAAPLVAQVLKGGLGTIATFARPSGMDIVVECVNAQDVEAAEAAGAGVYGMNLSVALTLGGIPGAQRQIIKGLLGSLPFGAFSVVGVSSLDELRFAKYAGADCVLVRRALFEQGGELAGMTQAEVVDVLEPILTGDD